MNIIIQDLPHRNSGYAPFYLTVFSFSHKSLDTVQKETKRKWGVMLGGKDNYKRSPYKGFWGRNELSVWKLTAELISYKV